MLYIQQIRHKRVRCEKCLFNPTAPGICPECLQSKELPWEMDVLMHQLQDIELQMCKSAHIPQLVPLAAIGRTAGGLQMSTATGKRKMEMLKFFERLWQMMFVDAQHNVPLFNNLKEQLDCFANEGELCGVGRKEASFDSILINNFSDPGRHRRRVRAAAAL